ncbi:hypothetical protein V2W30_12260 [Streptomyces sp. Q6]|uniref:Uncharacterized protein n=1 Tax=Streptomyces citrinus TaxID=3118173 RepID=A0ACD5AAT6_9ACTN
MTDIDRAREGGIGPGPTKGHTERLERPSDQERQERQERMADLGHGPDGAAAAPPVHTPTHTETFAATSGSASGAKHASGARSEIVPTEARAELEGRLRHAVTGFVDGPRAAVEEADHVLEDLTARLAETLAGRRRTLRTSWQESTDDTEQLRIALRDYRETAERLLKL